MRICNVTPGLLPIPPNGWGAVEKIIWAWHQELLKLGHHSEILYLDQVKKEDWDVVHIHVANLALMAHERGIPYYFSFHDHHAYLYGKDSELFKQNRAAIENSIHSFVPAKFLVDYFATNRASYFSHGVDTGFFKPSECGKKYDLLCVANNGWAYDPSYDRKGFRFAVLAAKTLNKSIAVAGPSNNKHFFEKNKDLLEYEKLTVLYDLSEQQLLELYQQSRIFLHPSELEAGHPNLTLLEALACGLPIVGTYEEIDGLDGMEACERDVMDMVDIINVIDKPENYKVYSAFARKQAERLSWTNMVEKLLTYYKPKPTMKEELLKAYNGTPLRPTQDFIEDLEAEDVVQEFPVNFNVHYLRGATVDIQTEDPGPFKVDISDDKGNLIYTSTINGNCYAKASTQYYVDYRTNVKNLRTGKEWQFSTQLQGQRVVVELGSKSLGDTLAWVPFMEEFRKKHNCELIGVTYHNYLFKEEYPEITFVEPGSVIENVLAWYDVGWYYFNNGELIDRMKNPLEPKGYPLQKTASDILGLEFKELRPRISFYPAGYPNELVDENGERIRYVCIATHATSQCKYWNHPTGWQELVEYFNSKGYAVVTLSKEPDGWNGNQNPKGILYPSSYDLNTTMNYLHHCKMFVGLSSGLSWLSWVLDKATVVISGFTEEYTEMKECIRIEADEHVCRGCFNWVRLQNDGDWNFCPRHKGTPRQFECSKTITPQKVINQIKYLLK